MASAIRTFRLMAFTLLPFIKYPLYISVLLSLSFYISLFFYFFLLFFFFSNHLLFYLLFFYYISLFIFPSFHLYPSILLPLSLILFLFSIRIFLPSFPFLSVFLVLLQDNQQPIATQNTVMTKFKLLWLPLLKDADTRAQ